MQSRPFARCRLRNLLGRGGNRDRRRMLVIVAGAVLAVVAVVLAMTVTGRDSGPAVPAPTPDAPPAKTGPLNGSYTVDFARAVEIDGVPIANSTPLSATWTIRSACLPKGCIATATSTGGPALQPTLVLDDVGGEWLGVAVVTLTSPPTFPGFTGCPLPGDYWEVIRLRPKADGTLAGEYRVVSAFDCNVRGIQRAMTSARIGDVNVDAMPDPASIPARVTSAGQALHGRYRETASRNGGILTRTDVTLRTDCLRSGDRCVSYKRSPNGFESMIFGDGRWVYDAKGIVTCSTDNRPAPSEVHQVYPLPEPPQNPITLLTGIGRDVVTGGSSCDATATRQTRLDRIGD